MIVHDFDVLRVAVLPTETNSPLIIHSNAVLALAIAFQRFEAVSGRDSQLPKLRRSMQN